jgi:hypothetical protein
MLRGLLGLAIAAGTLSACADGSPNSVSPQATSDESTVTQAPPTSSTSSSKSATNEQYASIVAKNTDKLSAVMRDLTNASHCDWSGLYPLDVRPGYLTCGIQITTVSLMAQTLDNYLKTASRQIGPAPSEVSALVDDTMNAARDIASTGDTADDCALEQGPGCSRKLFAFSDAMRHMQDELAAWRPYM